MKYVGCLILLTLLTGCYLNSALLDLNGSTQKDETLPHSLTLINYPHKVSESGLLDIAVTGSDLQGFRYKVGPANSIVCADGSGYSAHVVSIDSRILDDLSAISDQLIKICVVGVSSSGIQDDFSDAVEKEWYLDRVPTTVSLVKAEQSALETDGSNQSFVIKTSAVKPYDIEVNYSIVGDATYMLNHNLPLKGKVTIPAGQPTGSVLFQVLNDPTGNVTKYLQINIESADFNKALLGDVYQSRFFIKDVTTPVRPTALKVYLSYNNGCVLLSDASLKCWGYNTYGQLGTGNTTTSTTGISPIGGFSYSLFSTNGSGACGITTTGVLKCWGANSAGQVGDATFTTKTSPVTIDSGTSYSYVMKGAKVGERTCGITTTGVLKCWGSNDYGQVGDGSTAMRNTPRIVNSGTSYSSVDGNEGYTCGITTAGVLKCWGSNSLGQLGTGTTSDSSTPVVIDSGVSYSSVHVSGLYEYSTCAITTTGVLKCWGYNYYGQIGNGTTVDQLTPVVIDSGTTYSSVLLFGGTTCGITTAGVLKCWGNNSGGQIGDNSTTSRLTPTIVDSGTLYSKIVRAGESYSSDATTCGITTTGILKCWGGNRWGQLGLLSGANARVPNVVDPGISYIDIAAIEKNTCGVTTGGDIKCWGAADQITRGDTESSHVLTPKIIDGDTRFASLISTGSTNCALTVDSDLKCWGNNLAGEIGDGGLVNKTRPVFVDKGVKYRVLSMHATAVCGITIRDELKCWGMNDAGQVGDGTTVNKLAPVVIDSGTKYSFVLTYAGTTCGVTSSGVLKCWGRNTSGQIGDNTTVNKLFPTVIDAGVSYKSVVSGGATLCALTSAGVVKCWGHNGGGGIADGTTTNRLVPTIVNAGTTYKQIGAPGSGAFCGLTTANKLKCWGFNLFGTVGDGTTANKLAATAIDAATDYSKLSMEGGGACAFTTAGTLKCWGYNGTGMVGNGTSSTSQTTPALVDFGTTFSFSHASTIANCSITTDGVLKCWGSNSNGRVGNGTLTYQENTPIVIDPGVTYKTANTNSDTYTSCGITTDGILKCWGNNSLGSVGDGTAFFGTQPRSILRWITP